jgi:sugar transferase (PEP-CTERM/EpsH1 system associated)
MNILFVTPRLPYPPYRGDKLRMYNTVRILSRRHSISLLSFIQQENEREYIPALARYCRTLQVVLLPSSRSYLNCLLNIPSSVPFQVAYFYSFKMRDRLKEMLAAERFDIVHAYLIRMAHYVVGDVRAVPTILDLTDSISLYLKTFLDTTRNPLKKFLLFVEWSRMGAYERILSRFDRCLVCSDLDKKALEEAVPEARLDITPNGVDLGYFRPSTVAPDPHSIIYTGNMGYFPNTDGILYFYHDIFPHIKERVPDVKLYVVGQKPPGQVKDLARDSNVMVTGLVEDVRSYYLRSAVAICPIRFGAGTPFKVLESLALGVPVVSTAQGCAGLGVKCGRDILIADEPGEFAARVVELMEDRALWNTLSANGREFVEREHDWEDIVSRLEGIYGEVLDEWASRRG